VPDATRDIYSAAGAQRLEIGQENPGSSGDVSVASPVKVATR
jgi:hypothetical protein